MWKRLEFFFSIFWLDLIHFFRLRNEQQLGIYVSALFLLPGFFCSLVWLHSLLREISLSSLNWHLEWEWEQRDEKRVGRKANSFCSQYYGLNVKTKLPWDYNKSRSDHTYLHKENEYAAWDENEKEQSRNVLNHNFFHDEKVLFIASLCRLFYICMAYVTSSRACSMS